MTGDKDFDELLTKCFEVMSSKGKDYAEKDDRLAEFRTTAEAYDVSMQQVLGIYLNKHLRSVRKWLMGEELTGEPIEDKLLDVISYCLLAYKMSKESAQVPVTTLAPTLSTSEIVKQENIKLNHLQATRETLSKRQTAFMRAPDYCFKCYIGPSATDYSYFDHIGGCDNI